MVCDEFNQGNNLEYKFTKPDGYWTMTKGFINAGPKGICVHALADYLKENRDKAVDKKNQSLSKGARNTKKVFTKYK